MNALLTRAKADGTPLIDADQVTFVWAGREAKLLGDFNHWAMEMPLVDMVQVEPDVWITSAAVFASSTSKGSEASPS